MSLNKSLDKMNTDEISNVIDKYTQVGKKVKNLKIILHICTVVYQFLFIIMNRNSFKREVLSIYSFQLNEQSVINVCCMIHGVVNVYSFVRRLLECNYCVRNLMSHLLGYMIKDCLEMPNNYDLSKHEDYIRFKYSKLAKPFRLIRGEAYNRLDSNIHVWQ